MADEMFVVNYHDYIGESTHKEMRYAKEHDKTIRLFTLDPIGEKVSQLIETFMSANCPATKNPTHNEPDLLY